MNSFQSWAQVLTLGAILVGVLVYQTRYMDRAIDGLRNEFDKAIGGLRNELKAEIAGLLDLMNERFKHMDDRLDRIEHPVVRGA
jgi:hypothetical protein